MGTDASLPSASHHPPVMSILHKYTWSNAIHSDIGTMMYFVQLVFEF